ncbi:hypothetical protein CcaverHIS631_0111330 [Cutaneotrichosporon cavernicola]|nr:hypothetical protein CcaverHIS631_0111330 [Cutaneotrichosporon cavernicola]BEJ03955.1 hypothetical protein CcaverHIS641_0111300 [Cutaneotrichosporon cavernicola]
MSTSPVAKKMKSTKVIGTHSGTFHCDEALAVFLLRLTDQFKDADLVRTRDPTKLEPLDIVVDVGGVYDAEKERYDHHQRGFTEVFGHGFSTKLSSAGLVYKHYGKHIIARTLNLAEEEDKVHTLWLQLYSELIESIDAIDNGVNIADGALQYNQRTDLSSRVRRLNPRWNEPASDDVYDAKFAVASKMTGEEFLQQLDYFANAWLPARDIVAAAIEERWDVDPSGEIIMFKQVNECGPWKDHLFSIESTLQPPAHILYVLYPENPDKSDTKWRIQCVPKNSDSFENRKSLPEAWRGVRDADLEHVSGIPGAFFCHASGFIGGALTYSGVVAMARAALSQ